VEFYHDQGGVTLGKQKLTESVKNNICGKVTRQLVPGTLQVHHMKGYGAVEIGVHWFHHPGHEDTEGSAKRVSFISGNTKTAAGKSRESSATTTTPRPSNCRAQPERNFQPPITIRSPSCAARGGPLESLYV